MRAGRPSVVVTGSINMDIVATAAWMPRPGETVSGTALRYYPGGKGANQAIAAARAGASTRMVGSVGRDAFGLELVAYLAAQGVDSSLVATVEGSSGVAMIVVEDSGENAIVVVPGANGTVTAKQFDHLDAGRFAVGVSQFEIPVPAVEAFFRRCRDSGATTILNTAPSVRDVGAMLDLADVLVLNETELSTYRGVHLTAATPLDEIRRQAERVRKFDEQMVVVTLGARGVIALAPDRDVRIDGHSTEVVDTTGAGDCFVGYLAAGLAGGEGLERALRLANRAASVSVQRPGAAPSMPARSELGPV